MILFGWIYNHSIIKLTDSFEICIEAKFEDEELNNTGLRDPTFPIVYGRLISHILLPDYLLPDHYVKTDGIASF